MKAARIHEFGGPEVLQLETVPDPQPRPGEVLVQVKACALNHLDLWIRKGLPNVRLPHILGSDVAGVVTACGEYVDDIKAGDRVLLAPMVFCGHCQFCMRGEQNFCPEFSVRGYATDGGDCELVTAPRASVFKIPDALTYDEAASVPLVFLTAWHMLVSRAGIRHGQTVLVLGAGSGVGTAAIQIAKMLGCTVITTAGSEGKLDLARELGADYTIHHYREKISEEVRKITDRRMADVVFEHVGKATWTESMKSLRPGGTLVTCGATTGPDAALDLRFVYSRQLTLLGSFMGTMGDLHAVLKHVFSGRLKPVVDKTFPLHSIADAHRHLEKGDQFGKVIVNP